MQRLAFVFKGHILMTEFEKIYIIKVDILYLFEDDVFDCRPDRHLHISNIKKFFPSTTYYEVNQSIIIPVITTVFESIPSDRLSKLSRLHQMGI